MDCDGKRVQATENGTLTKFIGGHYEETGSQITKHYFAGASRIATRKYTVPSSMILEYVLGDHLGSSTVNTDGTTGAKVSEMRYKPWGEVRYSWKASASHSLADYTFTGQYSYMDDPSTSGVTEGFGLMFYNARWYDPGLGRFAQADSIVPAGVQGFDRYAYGLNNPSRYTDPSGHCAVEDDGDDCHKKPNNTQQKTYTEEETMTYKIEANFSVILKGNWTLGELTYLEVSLYRMAAYVGGVRNLNSAIVKAAQSYQWFWEANATTITIERISGGRWNPTSDNPSAAAWCRDNNGGNCSKNTIVFADDTFSECYQERTCAGPVYVRPTSFDLEKAIEFTMAHELAHVLGDASPAALAAYEEVWGGIEEDMANEIALDAISQGTLTTQFSGWAADYGFWSNP